MRMRSTLPVPSIERVGSAPLPVRSERVGSGGYSPRRGRRAHRAPGAVARPVRGRRAARRAACAARLGERARIGQARMVQHPRLSDTCAHTPRAEHPAHPEHPRLSDTCAHTPARAKLGAPAHTRSGRAHSPYTRSGRAHTPHTQSTRTRRPRAHTPRAPGTGAARTNTRGCRSSRGCRGRAGCALAGRHRESARRQRDLRDARHRSVAHEHAACGRRRAQWMPRPPPRS